MKRRKKGCSIMRTACFAAGVIFFAGLAAADAPMVHAADADMEALYKELGISTEQMEEVTPKSAEDADEPDPEKQEHYYKDFQPMHLSELLVTSGNRFEEEYYYYSKSHSTMELWENLKDPTLDSMKEMRSVQLSDRVELEKERDTSGGSWNGWQSTNSWGVDLDGDGRDEVASYTVWNEKLTITLYRYARNGGDAFDRIGSITIDMPGMNGYDIDARASKGLLSMTAGDYDEDGREELAFYVAGESIRFLELNDNDSIIELKNWDLMLSDFRDKEMHYEGWMRPVVGLHTTAVSGRDDLVINISSPMKDDGVYAQNDHLSTLAIYRLKDGSMQLMYDDQQLGFTPAEVSSNGRRHAMRFASSTDGDLNGDGVDELLTAGFRAQKFNNSEHEAGIVENGRFLVHAMSWNEKTKKYEKVWEYPKEVEAFPDSEVLEFDYSMHEPAAFAAGKIVTGNDSDYLFIEGVIVEWVNGASRSLTDNNAQLRKIKQAELTGQNHSFVSTAYTASFAENDLTREQIVYVSGDYQIKGRQFVFLDIGWIYGEGSGENAEIKGGIAYNDYVNDRPMADDGTYLSVCPVDIDWERDATYLKYKGKELAWSDPEVLTVVQSLPYWSEVPSDTKGEIWWQLDETTGMGTEISESCGMGVYMNYSMEVGGGLLGNSITAGFSTSLQKMATHLHNEIEEQSESRQITLIFPQGDDYVALLGIPVVRYLYDMWVPAYTVTEEHVKNYDALADEKRKKGVQVEDFPYKAGDKVQGHWEDYEVLEYGNSTYTVLTLDEYNAAAEMSDGILESIDEEFLPRVTTGDPSTYPRNDDEFMVELDGDIQDSARFTDQVLVSNNEATYGLTYTVTSSSTKGNGFSTSFDATLGASATVSSSLFEAVETSLEVGIEKTKETGSNWYNISSESLSLSAYFTGLEGCPKTYSYPVKLGVYRDKEKYDAAGEYTGPYGMGYVVAKKDTIPPKPGENFTADSSASSVTLRWENPSERKPESYRVYIRDKRAAQNAEEVEIGFLQADDDLTLTADGLEPDSEYQFALQAYEDAEGTTNPSCMSAWATVRTKPDDPTFPVITKQPQDLEIDEAQLEDDKQRTLTVEAQKGDGMTEELKYQWQQFDSSNAKWNDISGAKEASYIVPKKVVKKGTKSFFRVLITQMKGVQPLTVASDTAYVRCVSAEEGTNESATDMKIVIMDGQGKDVEHDGEQYYVEDGDDITAQVQIRCEHDAPPQGEVLLIADDEAMEPIEADIDENGYAYFELPDIDKGKYTCHIYYGGSSEGEVDGTDIIHHPILADAFVLNSGVHDHTVTYYLDGGVNAPDNPHSISCDTKKVVLDAPSKEGAVFDGWYFDEDFTRPVEDSILAPQDMGDDIKVYVKWRYEHEMIRERMSKLKGSQNLSDHLISYQHEW